VIGSPSMRHSFHSTHLQLLTRRADDPEKKFKVEFLAEQAALRERGEGLRVVRRTNGTGTDERRLEPKSDWIRHFFLRAPRRTLRLALSVAGTRKIGNHWRKGRKVIGSRSMSYSLHSTHSWLLTRRTDDPEKKSKLNS
jgi:hypothetical protein